MAAEGWTRRFARRAQARTSPELTAILAGVPPGVLAMTGGFPNPATFPGEVLDEIVARLVRDEPGVALQYTPCEGLPSVREYLADRQEQLQGRRPERAEIIVTSGGMECIQLMCQALVDPGDVIAVEAPTYLGALLAFAGIEADVHGIATDDDGLRVDALAEALDAGLRPKFLYVIPEYQNPTGRTLPLARRHALVELCRRHRTLIFEDVAYRELGFDGSALPSLWSLAPDLVVQAGTFSKVFFPGVRLGWAAGPADVLAELAAAKQNTDQCAGGLGQRMVEEYGRAGHFERRLPAARELYASRWRALRAALERHLPPGCSWTEPAGGFLTWVTLSEGLDVIALRPAATAAGVAYVPGQPFYSSGEGANEMRLSFSHLSEAELDQAVERLGGVVQAALDDPALSARTA
jgi:2-aminoadipate transaminase